MLTPCDFRDEDAVTVGVHHCSHPFAADHPDARTPTSAWCSACQFTKVRRPLPVVRVAPPARASSQVPRGRCRHLGEPTGESVACGTCPGSTRIKTFSCTVLGRCSFGSKQLPGVPFCGQDPVHGVGITCGAFSAVEVPSPDPFPREGT